MNSTYQSIPLIVKLWKDPNSGDNSQTWQGHQICLVSDTQDLEEHNFNDCTSAIEILPGPHYDPNVSYKVTFYGEKNYLGAILELGIGEYPDLRHPHNFNDMISSVKFNAVSQPTQINPNTTNIPNTINIPLVAELYEGIDYEGKKLIVVGDIPDLAICEFDEKTLIVIEHKIVSSVKVFKGPNYDTDGKKYILRLYRDKDYKGGHIDLSPEYQNGEYRDLGIFGFDNEALSLKIVDINNNQELVG